MQNIPADLNTIANFYPGVLKGYVLRWYSVESGLNSSAEFLFDTLEDAARNMGGILQRSVTIPKWCLMDLPRSFTRVNDILAIELARIEDSSVTDIVTCRYMFNHCNIKQK